LRAAGSPRWYEPIEDALERVPSCPEILAYRGVRFDDTEALQLAIQLAPELIGDFTAMGIDLGAAVGAALDEAEQRGALLARARAAADSVRRRIDAAPPEPPATVSTKHMRAEERLHAANLTIGLERRGLGAEFAFLDATVRELLDTSTTAGAMTIVRAARQASAGIVTALRETDRPTSVRAFGLPPRRPPGA
jgi:hypothetical protein